MPKSNASYRSWITKINSIFIDHAEDLDLVMPMYNLLKYGHNYFMASRNFWNYDRDETDDVVDNASKSKSFKFKIKIIGKTDARTPRSQRPPEAPQNLDGYQSPRSAIPPLNREIVIPLKYLSNFWRSLNFSLIKCEIEPDLSW